MKKEKENVSEEERDLIFGKNRLERTESRDTKDDLEEAIEIWRLLPGIRRGMATSVTCEEGACEFDPISVRLSLYGCNRCGRIHEIGRKEERDLVLGENQLECTESRDKKDDLEEAIEIWRLLPRIRGSMKAPGACEEGKCKFDDISDRLSLYGCILCGRIHECDGTGNACPATRTDDHEITLCLASKRVLRSGSQLQSCFYQASARGNGTCLDYEEEINMKDGYFGEAVGWKEGYFGEVVGSGSSETRSPYPWINARKKASEAAGTKRKRPNPVLWGCGRRGMPDGRDEYREVSWENLPENKLFVATAQGVILDMLWDPRKRRKINDSLLRRAREGASNAVLRHTKKCLRDGMHPNYFDLEKMYDHHSAKHPPVEANVPQDTIRVHDLIKRAVLLWKFLRGTPDYRKNGSRYHQKNVYLAFLYMQCEGYFLNVNGRRVSILPSDPFLERNLPPRNDVHMLGNESRSYQTRLITKGTRCVASGLQSSRELPGKIASEINGVDLFGERERERERENNRPSVGWANNKERGTATGISGISAKKKRIIFRPERKKKDSPRDLDRSLSFFLFLVRDFFFCGGGGAPPTLVRCGNCRPRH